MRKLTHPICRNKFNINSISEEVEFQVKATQYIMLSRRKQKLKDNQVKKRTKTVKRKDITVDRKKRKNDK